MSGICSPYTATAFLKSYITLLSISEKMAFFTVVITPREAQQDIILELNFIISWTRVGLHHVLGE